MPSGGRGRTAALAARWMQFSRSFAGMPPGSRPELALAVPRRYHSSGGAGVECHSIEVSWNIPRLPVRSRGPQRPSVNQIQLKSPFARFRVARCHSGVYDDVREAAFFF